MPVILSKGHKIKILMKKKGIYIGAGIKKGIPI